MPLTPEVFTEAFLSLPSLGAQRTLHATNQSSVMITCDDRSSLSSLFESWEKLSVGDIDGSRLDIDMENSTMDESCWVNIAAEQFIATEINTAVMKD